MGVGIWTGTYISTLQRKAKESRKEVPIIGGKCDKLRGKYGGEEGKCGYRLRGESMEERDTVRGQTRLVVRR